VVNKRNNEWERDSEVYSPSQVEAVAEYCGLSIDGETATHFLAYCPFHGNADTPAFALDKIKGLWTCFNPSCGNSGNLMTLLSRLKGLNPFEARRLILKYENVSGKSKLQASREVEPEPDFVEFPSEPVRRMTEDFWDYLRPQSYMINERKFNEETLRHFEIGYSKKRDMVVVPMHDPKGMLVGFIGRSIEDKVFKNSDNLPKSKTAWNYHRAKTHGDTVIVVESSFDAMRVHQAGYPNVVALLGGSFSKFHRDQFNKTFSTIIVMTDFDKRQRPKPNCRACANRPADEHGIRCVGHRPGRELGHSIADQLPNKKIMWAAYDDNCVYPHDAKDVGDMTDDEIRQCLKNAISNFAYLRWDVENHDLLVAS
jgi:DNA primase